MAPSPMTKKKHPEVRAAERKMRKLGIDVKKSKVIPSSQPLRKKDNHKG